MVTKRGTGGRPSKGARDAIYVRPPADLGALIRENADAEGMTYSDYCAMLIAHSLDRADLAPVPDRSRDQEVLPLANTA